MSEVLLLRISTSQELILATVSRYEVASYVLYPSPAHGNHPLAPAAGGSAVEVPLNQLVLVLMSLTQIFMPPTSAEVLPQM